MDKFDTSCPEQICENNRAFVHWVIKTSFPSMRYDEDFFQVAWIGLWEAAKCYDESKNAKFLTFAALVIKRRCLNELKRRYRYEGQISLDECFEDTDIARMDTLESPDDVAGTVISRTFVESLISNVRQLGLTEKQSRIMDEKISGKTMTQISRDMGIRPSQVTEGMNAIRRKFQKLAEAY